MSPILFFIIFFICTGVEKIFLQINSAAVAFIDILIAAWEGLIIRKLNEILKILMVQAHIDKVKSPTLHTEKSQNLPHS